MGIPLSGGNPPTPRAMQDAGSLIVLGDLLRKPLEPKVPYSSGPLKTWNSVFLIFTN
jgi:hypothetical protein